MSAYSLTKECEKVLDLDEKVRFVGRIKERQVVAFIRRDDSEPLLNEEMGNLAHYQASVKAGMEEMFDGQLGKTNWMITCKEFVKMITLFLDDGLLILSIESNGNHDQIIQKIQGLNTKF
ncbi:MAG: hypothetical protein GKS07_07550 [Nitrosopumilus sp.]|nr:MAG: hypothetical protein GKS07_07550 [Nitrosopumilus sp.]